MEYVLLNHIINNTLRQVLSMYYNWIKTYYGILRYFRHWSYKPGLYIASEDINFNLI